MRCKNCGSENDENRYICANCGSPLYDEEELQSTKVVPVQKTESEHYDNTDTGYQNDAVLNRPNGDNDNKSDKKSIIVIAILAVVLIAIVTSVIVVANTKKNNAELSTTNQQTTTQLSTTKPTTTKETTTRETTTAETTKANCTVTLFSKGGGTVICSKSGTSSSSYERGENVTIIATPDSEYQFDGWYSDGVCLSTAATYSFTVTSNINISAQFSIVTTTSAPTQENTTSENIIVYE